MWVQLSFLFGIVSALSLEKPFPQTEWTFSGDVVPGVDVVRIGTKDLSLGSIWSKLPYQYNEWTFEATLRAFKGTGTPLDSGMALWFTSSPLTAGPVHGSADAWDGLAVMMDSLGWDSTTTPGSPESGAIRAHLNDGTDQFLKGGAPAEQAFSLCRIHYRATGGPIVVRIGYGRGAFVVDVNGQRCLATDKVSLPSGYYFGVSANTDKSGDTFALDSMKVEPGLASDLAAHIPAKPANPIRETLENRPPPRFQPPQRPPPPVQPPPQQPPAQQAPPVQPPPVPPAPATDAFKQELAALIARVDALQARKANDELPKNDAQDYAIASIKSTLDGLVQNLASLGTRITTLETEMNRISAVTNRLEADLKRVSDSSSKIDKAASKSDIEDVNQRMTSFHNIIEAHKSLIQKTGVTVAENKVSYFTIAVIAALTQAITYFVYRLSKSRPTAHYKLL